VEWTPSPAELTGTATASTASSITLGASALATANLYCGMTILITSGTGKGQCRLISGYTAGRVATVTPAWTTTPATTATYIMLPTGPSEIEGLLFGNRSTGAAVVAFVEGIMRVDIGHWLSQTVGATINGIPIVDPHYWNGAAVAATNTNGVPVVDTRQLVRQGTAQATGNSTTAIKLDAGASATNDFYKGKRIAVISGLGAPQDGICTAYNGTTKVATVYPAWPTAPDNTSLFQIFPASADVEAWQAVGAVAGAIPAAVAGAAGGVLIAGSNAPTTFAGSGSTAGLTITGGATAPGALMLVGGATSGDGFKVTTTSGNGITLTPTNGHGFVSTGQGAGKDGINVSGARDGLRLSGGTGNDIQANFISGYEVTGAVVYDSNVTILGLGGLAVPSGITGGIDIVQNFSLSALSQFFLTNSGTTYASAVAGSVVKETANNANMTAVGGSTTAADQLKAMFAAAVSVVVDTATFTATATVFETQDTTDSIEKYREQVLYGVTGANAGVTVPITGYVFSGNSKVKLTVETLPSAPANGDIFLKMGRIEQ
jgi:hypothetical protein